jgi:hypothetical protein
MRRKSSASASYFDLAKETKNGADVEAKTGMPNIDPAETER